jgi:hypothetical protein
MGVLTALAIGIHNVPEGMATFVVALREPAMGTAIAVAIALHDIPAGIAVSIPVFSATGSRQRAFSYSLLSGVAEPVGAAVVNGYSSGPQTSERRRKKAEEGELLGAVFELAPVGPGGTDFQDGVGEAAHGRDAERAAVAERHPENRVLEWTSRTVAPQAPISPSLDLVSAVGEGEGHAGQPAVKDHHAVVSELPVDTANPRGMDQGGAT